MSALQSGEQYYPTYRPDSPNPDSEQPVNDPVPDSEFPNYSQALARDQRRFVADVEHARGGSGNPGGASHAGQPAGSNRFTHGTGLRERLISAAELREARIERMKRYLVAPRHRTVVYLDEWRQRPSKESNNPSETDSATQTR